MSSRTTRASSRKTRDAVSDVSNASEELDAAPPAKKRATAKSRKRGGAVKLGAVKLGAKTGGLEVVTRLPLDVLYEIFRLLHPRDLLALARTTKAVRAVLLNPSCAAIWITTLAAINDDAFGPEPLPPCPENLQPPQYASLAFDTFCTHCGKENARIQHFNLQIRMCSQCSKSQLCFSSDYLVSLTGEEALTADEQDKLEELIPKSVSLGSPYLGLSYVPQIQSIVETWRQVPDQDQEAYLDEQTRRRQAIEDHAIKWMCWYENQRLKRSQDLDELRQGRQESVLQRLLELGWDEEFEFDPECILEHPLVNKPQALTDRIWQNIRPVLLETMESIRRRLQDYEFKLKMTLQRMKLRQFIRGPLLRHVSVLPTIPDLGDIENTDFFEDLYPLMDEKNVDADDALVEQLQAVATASFPAALAAWRQSLAVELYDWTALGAHGQLLRLNRDKSAADKLAWLNLATTTFMCEDYIADPGSCVRFKSFRYPAVMAHSCNQGSCSDDKLVCTPWRVDGLQFDVLYASVIADLVRAVGLDEATATFADMDALDARLVCTTCGDEHARVMSWWRCLSHFAYAHAVHAEEPGAVQWARLPPAMEAKARDIAPLVADDLWRCMACDHLEVCRSWDSALIHAYDAHGLDPADVVRGTHVITEDLGVRNEEPAIVTISDLRAAAGIENLL